LIAAGYFFSLVLIKIQASGKKIDNNNGQRPPQKNVENGQWKSKEQIDLVKDEQKRVIEHDQTEDKKEKPQLFDLS
jgi:hypothetical protein